MLTVLVVLRCSQDQVFSCSHQLHGFSYNDGRWRGVHQHLFCLWHIDAQVIHLTSISKLLYLVVGANISQYDFLDAFHNNHVSMVYREGLNVEDETWEIFEDYNLPAKKTKSQLHTDSFSPKNSSLLIRVCRMMVLNIELKSRWSSLIYESRVFRWGRAWWTTQTGSPCVKTAEGPQWWQPSPWCEPKPFIWFVLKPERRQIVQ